MKRKWVMIAWLWMVGAGMGFGAEEPILEDTSDDWRITVGPAHEIYLFNHDALQSRMNDLDSNAENWRNGDVEGGSWGLRVVGGKGAKVGDGFGTVTIMMSSYEWEFIPEVNNLHQIHTDRRDFEGLWSQYTMVDESARLGWTLGFRYLGSNKRIVIEERDGNKRDSMDRSDNNTWLLLTGGYFGEWRPFDSDICMFSGYINGLFGEVDGIARSGKDISWDGDIDEEYKQSFSIAYGMNAGFGLRFAIFPRVSVLVAYEREWMYSFESTDTGVVMFPDNNDALFIDNSHTVLAALNILL